MIDPFRDSSESLSAELARVSRERDEMERRWLAERSGAMPTTGAYLRALAAMTVCAVGGILHAGLNPPGIVGAAAFAAGMWILRPALRRMKPEPRVMHDRDCGCTYCVTNGYE